MNLCTNAYQAMEGLPGVIDVKLNAMEISDETFVGTDSLKGSYVLLQVANTGIGISEENIDRIFEPFFTTKEKGKGTGIGLSVVHGIVKSCGGSISVSSEANKETVFSIYLPRIEDREIRIASTTTTDSPRSKKGEHLMLVDDDPTILAMEKKMFTSLGYQVSIFSKSPVALKFFKTNPNSYDIVIMDYSMPDMTGDQLAKEIQKIRKDIPLVLLTGFSGQINKANAEKMGIKAYIMKPVILNELAHTVRNVIDGEKQI